MNFKQLLFISGLLCLSVGLPAQDFVGTVYYQDPKGNKDVLPYAQVLYLEQQSLIDCDQDGRFTLHLHSDATLVATYIGYSQDTVRVRVGTPSTDFLLTGSNELQEAVKTARQAGLQRLSQIKTEAITAAGLCKMACCNLAESFENTASISVGYSDAITGARQIKLLGLSGVYTQMQDEKMPVMRALSSTFGLNYIPGQWLESIYIAKGPASVANDAGGITGQINVEHRKPLDETALYVNLYASSDNMYDGTVVSAQQLNDRWSTIMLAYFSNSNSYMDHNCDGFRDDPKTRQINLSNRWLYSDPGGLQARFGFKVVNDRRQGGQMDFTRDMAGETSPAAWGSLILNRLYNAYFKLGLPLAGDSSSLALVTSYNRYESDASFGCNSYLGLQNSVFANLIYHNDFNENNTLELALTGQWDMIDEDYRLAPYGIGLAEHASFERNSQKKDEVDTDDEKIVRHFAIDDVGRLIDFRVPAEFDAIKHSYYCPNCGKEVFLNVDDNSNYSFAHVTEDSSCDDEMYLRCTAVAAIHQAFVDSPKFIIEVPQYRSCKQADKCPCNQDCKAPTIQQYDLKAHRYLKCEKDYKFGDVLYRTDLAFYREDILKDSIEVRVNTENFDLELETPRRLIDVTVHSEKDICQLEKGLNGYENVHFLGFNQDSKEKAEPREIQNEVLKYTVYASGKIHIGSVKCTEIRSGLNRTSILREGVFTKTTGFIDDMYVFLLFRYKALQKELCLCRLCCYLKVGGNGEYICSRYKTVGTPRNPLNENNPPKECAYFRMNYNIQNQENALNEEMEIVEL